VLFEPKCLQIVTDGLTSVPANWSAGRGSHLVSEKKILAKQTKDECVRFGNLLLWKLKTPITCHKLEFTIKSCKNQIKGCDFTFPVRSTLYAHEKGCKFGDGSRKGWKSCKCGYMNPDASTMNKHQIAHTKYDRGDMSYCMVYFDDNQNEVFQCNLCNTTYDSMQRLGNHMKSHR